MGPKAKDGERKREKYLLGKPPEDIEGVENHTHAIIIADDVIMR